MVQFLSSLFIDQQTFTLTLLAHKRSKVSQSVLHCVRVLISLARLLRMSLDGRKINLTSHATLLAVVRLYKIMFGSHLELSLTCFFQSSFLFLCQTLHCGNSGI